MDINRRQFLAAAAASALPATGAQIERQFADASGARMIMHWYIFGPAWTADEARRQLKLMQAAHIGGVLIFPTYPIALDDPAHGIRNLPFLSSENLAILRSVLADAQALGMTADLVCGTGWPYGGPSVRVEDSAHMLRSRSVRVSAGRAELPGGGAGEERVAMFDQAGEPLGSVPSGYEGQVQVFYSTSTRMQVKRAAVGAEGLVLDHYNPGALNRYLEEVGEKLLTAVPPGGLRAIFCDSLEVYQANWTPQFLEIFRQRRGYDLRPHLPALWDEGNPHSRDLRTDFWRTLSEQAVDGFVKPLQAWAHRHGVLSMVEAYGSPPVSIAAYAYTDIPTGEHYEWKEFNSSRWASSGGHLAGKPVIMAEAWTWAGMPNRFGDSLEQLKLCSDLHFLSGINALYGVTYAYSPVELGAPGWPPYFGPVTNHTAPYWPHFVHFADYVNRASFVLQQGKPVADVALYLPVEDCMAEAKTQQLMLNWATRDRMSSNGPPPEFRLRNALAYESDVVKTIVTNGYAFDGVDTFTLNGAMRVEQGRLRMGDGDYSVVVLPNLAGIDVASIEKIASFVRAGGSVIATRRMPETAWGMHDREVNRARVRQLVVDLFGSPPRDQALTMNRYGQGRSIFARDERAGLLQALRDAQAPDVSFAEASEHVSFVHRRAGERDFYFLANVSTEPQNLDATFRVGNARPETWDLMTGRIAAQPAYEHNPRGTRVRLCLKPLESRVVVFTPAQVAGCRTNLPSDGRVRENGTYVVERSGTRRTINVSGIPAPVQLLPEWRLSFSDESIRPLAFRELKSWTEMPQARFFSGMGIYECDFEAGAPSGFHVLLDLGRVCETAGVLVNGAHVGVAWMRPYELDITRSLHPGRNRLRVEVTNLLINQVLGKGRPDYSALNAKYGTRFPPGEEGEAVREPFVSGLLGPVRLVFYKSVIV